MRNLLSKLLILFIIGFESNSYAQGYLSVELENSYGNLPYHEVVSKWIEPLDKSYITTGLLADKAFPFINMHGYNGLTDSIVTLMQWEQIHQQLYLASVTRTISLLPDSLCARKSSLLRQGIVPIALMNLKYNQFKPYAIDSNLIMVSEGKLHDVPGRIESPYHEKRLFAGAVLKDRIGIGRVTFRLDDNLFLTNSSESVSMVEIDFADGRGYRSYSMSNLLNNDVTVSYRQAGTKTITIRMTLTDQTVLQTKTRITLVLPPRVEPDETLEITGQAYDGVEGKGKAYILYGCGNDRTLRKPIIVSDGFDPGNERDFYGLYELLNGEELQFVEKARAEGFDFVVLDYENGTDSIQRNAFVMVSLIEEVNRRLGDCHPRLTIIGPSMGGLITRYALNYMEQHGKNHNTGLYVSFDSPHLGANIPLGDQCLLDFLASLGLKQAKNKLKMLNSAAARQMLLYHYGNNTLYGGHDRLRDELLRDPYFCYPNQCRKVAVANGSGAGISLFEPGEQMLSSSSSFWWGSLANAIGLRISAWAIPNVREYVFYGEMLYGLIEYSRIIENAVPFDGGAGGTRDVNKEIEESSFGIITSYHDDICFIPVISSLALNTNDVNYRVHDIPGYPFPSSNITPFDAIYAPIENQEHVMVTNENIAWIMNEIGAFDLCLQNQTVDKATDFEARNSITTGREVMNHIPVGDFIVQNSEGKVELHSEGIIRLMDGTHLKPEEEGVVRLWISEFPCASMFAMRGHPLRNNTSEETELEEWNATSDSESVAQSVAEKLPRNHPNPCGDITTIEYELDGDARVEIEVYSLMGIRLMTVEDRHGAGAGRYATTLNTSSLPTGMYVVVVKANGETNGVLKMQVVE